jgi:hypothetical protein
VVTGSSFVGLGGEVNTKHLQYEITSTDHLASGLMLGHPSDKMSPERSLVTYAEGSRRRHSLDGRSPFPRVEAAEVRGE